MVLNFIVYLYIHNGIENLARLGSALHQISSMIAFGNQTLYAKRLLPMIDFLDEITVNNYSILGKILKNYGA